MTKYIVAYANTNSEWDFVDYMLIEADDQFQNKIKSLKAIWEVNATTEPLSASFMGFYSDNMECFNNISELEKIIPKDIYEKICPPDSYGVIELTEEQYNSLTKIEQRIYLGTWELDKYNFTVKTFGKHTGEEYWCNLPLDFMSLFK